MGIKAPIRIPYAKPMMGRLSLLDPTSTVGAHLAALPAAIAAGDIKVLLDDGRLATGTAGPANPTARILGLDSVSSWPLVGDALTEDGGDGTGTVLGVVPVSGVVGSGTGAGFVFLGGVTGTWTDNATVTNATRSISDVGTVDAGTTGVYTEATNQIANTAGLFAFANGYAYYALTAAETTGRSVSVKIKDQTATELWVDTGDDFMTEDHPLAGDPDGCLYAGTAQSVANGTLVGQASIDGIGNPLSGDANIAPCLVVYIESATVGAGQAVPVSSFTHGTLTYNLLHNWHLNPTGTIVYKVYSIARMPAHVVAAVSGVQMSLVDDAITAAKFDESTAFPVPQALTFSAAGFGT